MDSCRLSWEFREKEKMSTKRYRSAVSIAPIFETKHHISFLIVRVFFLQTSRMFSSILRAIDFVSRLNFEEYILNNKLQFWSNNKQIAENQFCRTFAYIWSHMRFWRANL